MSERMTFEEVLDLAAVSDEPIAHEVKAWNGRKVYIKHPSSADVDAWRIWCQKVQQTGQPFAAKLVQMLLCDADGNRIIPQTDAALARLAESDPRAINEIASVCLPLVNEPSDQELDDEKKV